MAPKISSAAAIACAAALLPVASTIQFSSSASLFGAPGQANYAAANAALESTSLAAAARGVPSTAVQWGAWAAGMATLSTLQIASSDKGKTLRSAFSCAAVQPLIRRSPEYHCSKSVHDRLTLLTLVFYGSIVVGS